MTPEQFLERVRPEFATLPGALTFESRPVEPGYHELRFEHEAYNLTSVVEVPDAVLETNEVENKLFEAQAMAESIEEYILIGQVPFRAGFPKPGGPFTEAAE